MVKIVEAEEQHDAGSDDEDCYEICLEEFAKKVNLKQDDDVILVAAKGKIVKVEAGQPEDSAKAHGDYEIEAECSCIRGQAAGGDCMGNPFKIDEDETSLVKVEDTFVTDKLSRGGVCHKNERSSCITANVIPAMLVVPAVKCEAVGDSGFEEASYDHCLDLEMPHEKRIFDEDDDEEVVVV